MPAFNEPIRQFAGVLYKIDPLSIEKATIANGAGVLVPGTVLGRVTANGHLQKYTHDNDPAGTNVAVGVLVEHVDATSATATASFVARLAAVDAAQLVWDATVDDDTKKGTGMASLKLQHILAQ